MAVTVNGAKPRADQRLRRLKRAMWIDFEPWAVAFRTSGPWLVAELTGPDGETVTASEGLNVHGCTCDERKRDGFTCKHLRALMRYQLFRLEVAWGTPHQGADHV